MSDSSAEDYLGGLEDGQKKAAAEIERLQARVKELESMLHHAVRIVKKRACRVATDELPISEAILANLYIDIAAVINTDESETAKIEVELLRARVEELEQESKQNKEEADEMEKAWKECLSHRASGHRVTPEMIDAAWTRMICRLRASNFISRHHALGIEWALKNFHIRRCEGCKGSGRAWAPWDDQVLCPCPDCAPWDSKGWVIGEDDE
jgi:hypothetical protein